MLSLAAHVLSKCCRNWRDVANGLLNFTKLCCQLLPKCYFNFNEILPEFVKFAGVETQGRRVPNGAVGGRLPPGFCTRPVCPLLPRQLRSACGRSPWYLNAARILRIDFLEALALCFGKTLCRTEVPGVEPAAH